MPVKTITLNQKKHLHRARSQFCQNLLLLFSAPAFITSAIAVICFAASMTPEEKDILTFFLVFIFFVLFILSCLGWSDSGLNIITLFLTKGSIPKQLVYGDDSINIQYVKNKRGIAKTFFAKYSLIDSVTVFEKKKKIAISCTGDTGYENLVEYFKKPQNGHLYKVCSDNKIKVANKDWSWLDDGSHRVTDFNIFYEDESEIIPFLKQLKIEVEIR